MLEGGHLEGLVELQGGASASQHRRPLAAAPTAIRIQYVRKGIRAHVVVAVVTARQLLSSACSRILRSEVSIATHGEGQRVQSRGHQPPSPSPPTALGAERLGGLV